MKKIYNTPDATVEELSIADVISTSNFGRIFKWSDFFGGANPGFEEEQF